MNRFFQTKAHLNTFFLLVATVVMVDKQIILDTIQKMLNSGLTDAVIVSTLKDVGLKENDIQSYLSEAKQTTHGNSVQLVETNEPPVLSALRQKNPASGIIAESKQDELHQENMLLHTTTHAALENSSAQLSELGQKFDSLQQKISALSSLPIGDLAAKLSMYDKRMAALSADVTDLKAQTRALRDVLEKVLDTNRTIVQEMQSKKN